jgi:hypothetical protein
MEEAVRRVVALPEDSVVVIDLGPAEGVAKHRIKALGQKKVAERSRCVVV